MGIVPLIFLGVIVWLVLEATRRRDEEPLARRPSTPFASTRADSQVPRE